MMKILNNLKSYNKKEWKRCPNINEQQQRTAPNSQGTFRISGIFRINETFPPKNDFLGKTYTFPGCSVCGSLTWLRRNNQA